MSISRQALTQTHSLSLQRGVVDLQEVLPSLPYYPDCLGAGPGFAPWTKLRLHCLDHLSIPYSVRCLGYALDLSLDQEWREYWYCRLP